MKYPTDFRKTVETGVDLRLPLLKSHGINLDWKLLLRSKLTSHDNDATIVLLLYEVSQKSRRGISRYFGIYA